MSDFPNEAPSAVDALDSEAGRLLHDLHFQAQHLSTQELRALVLVARRLRDGAERYGRLDPLNDTRDWVREAGEEAADLLAYLCFESLRRAK